MKKESGNILIIILIAIFLLGSLTAMLSRSGGSSNETGDFEQQSLLISSILNYSSGIEQAVSLLRQRGCSENQISFENDILAIANPNAPLDESCHVFSEAGAGKTYELIPDAFNNGGSSGWTFTGENVFSAIETTCPAASCVDLAMVGVGVNEDVCLAINTKLGIVNPSGDLPEDTNISTGTHFQGTFTPVQAVADEAGGTNIAGQKSGCFTETVTGLPVFYRVLIPR